MMKLFYSPFHSFAHKTLVVAHEAGLWEDIEFVPSFPFRNLQREFVTGQYDLSAIAPLGKVPCLALEDGRVLYASQTVVEYLDAHRTVGKSLYPTGLARWDAVTRLALGDAIFEFAVQMSMERWISSEERRGALFSWLWPKIIAALGEAERWAAGNPPFDIGAVGLLQGLSYLGEQGPPDDPVHPDFRWRTGHPNLSRWYDNIIERASVRSHLNRDYEGDTSSEQHERHVAEVLETQRNRE